MLRQMFTLASVTPVFSLENRSPVWFDLIRFSSAQINARLLCQGTIALFTL